MYIYDNAKFSFVLLSKMLSGALTVMSDDKTLNIIFDLRLCQWSPTDYQNWKETKQKKKQEIKNNLT